jgi:tubby-related protein 1
MASLREELALVSYEMNVLGFKGPRKMTVLIPVLDKNSERIKVKPMTESDTLYERFKIDDMSNLVKLYNKSPKWSKGSSTHTHIHHL